MRYFSGLIFLMSYAISFSFADDEDRIMSAICKSYSEKTDVFDCVREFTNVKLYAYIDGVEDKTEHGYVEIKANISKYQQPPSRIFAKKYKMNITFKTKDLSLLKARIGSRIAIEGTVSSIRFFPEKLAKPDEINYSELLILDAPLAAEKAKEEQEKTKQTIAKDNIEKAMSGKTLAVIIYSATSGRFGMTISGVVAFRAPIEANYLSIRFGVYNGSTQTGSALDNIASFKGGSWAFSARDSSNADSYKLHEIIIDGKKYDPADVLVLTKEEAASLVSGVKSKR